MTSENKVFIGVLLVIALGIGWLVVSGSQGEGSPAGSPHQSEQLSVGLQEGDQAPAFSITTIDGETITSEMLRGQVVILTTSAAWCPTCVIEAQQFAPVYEKYQDEPVTFLTIDIDPNVTVDQIEQFRRDNGTPWAYTQAAGAAQWIQDYKIDRFEITYVIGQDGVIYFKDGEITSSANLDAAIGQLL